VPIEEEHGLESMIAQDTLDYATYIASETWENRRRVYFDTHPTACELCGYERMGAEDDEDLMALCKTCHSSVHTFADNNPAFTLREATLAFFHRFGPHRDYEAVAGSVRAKLRVDCATCGRFDARRPLIENKLGMRVHKVCPTKPKSSSPKKTSPQRTETVARTNVRGALLALNERQRRM